MTANQRQLTTNTKATPAPMPAVRIKSGTAMGNVSDPARGRISTRAFFRATWLGSEPLVLGLLRSVGVVLRGLALKCQGDVAALLAIGSDRLDGVELMSIAEGHLNTEGAIG